jgi:hypothetical protein
MAADPKLQRVCGQLDQTPGGRPAPPTCPPVAHSASAHARCCAASAGGTRTRGKRPRAAPSHGRSGQAHILVRPSHELYVGYVPCRGPLFKALEHGRLKIIRVDHSSGTDQACKPHRHESAAGPHIGDDHSGLDPNQLQRSIGLFLLLAGGAIEPSGIRVDVRDLPSSQGIPRGSEFLGDLYEGRYCGIVSIPDAVRVRCREVSRQQGEARH